MKRLNRFSWRCPKCRREALVEREECVFCFPKPISVLVYNGVEMRPDPYWPSPVTTTVSPLPYGRFLVPVK